MAAPHSQHLTAMKNETGVNVDALSAEHTQFHGSTPRDKPLTAKGHQPGRKVSPNDNVATFSAQSYPPGTAPKKDTYEPQNDYNPPHGAGDDVTQSWQDLLPGATSRDVYKGLGHPIQGQTSHEIRHDGHRVNKRFREGLEGKFGSKEMGDKGAGNQQVDTSRDPAQRGLDREFTNTKA